MSSVRSFYHYTSTAGAKGIRTDKVLRSQNGVKLSTLKPEDHTRDDILHSIYGKTIPLECKNRADYVVLVSESTLDPSKLFEITPNLYQYAVDIKISPHDVRDKPKYVNQRSNGSSSGWSRSSGTPNYLYYYTNQNAAYLIMSSGDIPYNNAIFLTTMKPEDYYRDEILKIIYGNNYDRRQYASSADWCIKIDSAELDPNKLTKNHDKVFKYAGSIQVDASDVMDKPACTKGGQNQR